MDACYNAQGRAQRCMPIFENAAFGRQAPASNTCGWPPETYCLQMGTRESSTLCHRCDAADPLLHHNASYLTDFHSQEEPTWWQSQSMAFGVQHPTSVNITLHLASHGCDWLQQQILSLDRIPLFVDPEKKKPGQRNKHYSSDGKDSGKSYEITYVRLKFHTSRPESFAIYKRSQADGPWIPYQFYSASCKKTYGKPERQFLRSGEHEQVALCTDEFSDISPLSGGNVAFSTLEGRPSAYSFDQSPLLQEWVTCTDLLISLDRLNTFGDDIFKDPKVLQSYYYAISDFSVGGRCKCNGHASECIPNEEDRLVCLCQHNTTGVDCEICQPFYQDRPWARGTAESPNECLPCNCSGRSEECYYDWELYRRTGHGGHCVNCRDNTGGPHCEYCRPNFYRWDDQIACQPCNCNQAGSLNPQCDAAGKCECKATVTGWKCERCQEGFHSLSEGGCRPCACNFAGSLGMCDPNSGHCKCKTKVEGYLCNKCQPGSFNLQPHNPKGCTSCFCYGHSTVCTTAPGYEPCDIVSDFRQGLDSWKAEHSEGQDVFLRWDGEVIFVDQNEQEVTGFKAPGDQHFSYGQLLSVVLHFEDNTTDASSPSVQLILEGNGVSLSARHKNPEERRNDIPCEERIVSFRIALKEIRLASAHPGFSQRAPWVEECLCPQGYQGRFCEFCAPGYQREIAWGGPFASICQCLHNTEGPGCERCAVGFYGNPFLGQPDDCQACPCPGQGPCTTMVDNGEVPATVTLMALPMDRKLVTQFRCHLMGAQSNICHPITGQCICHPGVAGLSCNRCQAGFFGFSSQGCQACNCSQIGSVSLHCHDNSTCGCKKGFVGSKCDHCDVNYFFDLESKQCQECPLCYSLVKEETDRLKDKLTEIEAWFQKPSCDQSKDKYYHTVFGESPRGDNLEHPYLWEGAQAIFLEKMTDLKDLVEDALHRLSNTSRTIACDGHRATKMCGLHSDEPSSEILYLSTNWSHHAIRSGKLARSGEKIERTQKDLVLQMQDAEILVSGHQSNATLVQTDTLPLRPLVEKAGNLVQKAEGIQQLVETKHGLAINKSLAIQTGLKEELQRTRPLEETLVVDPKGRAAVKRKRVAVQGRGIAETQRKIKQAQRVLVEMTGLGQDLRQAQRSLEVDIKALKHLLSKLGNLDQSVAVLHANQVQLANLRLRLAGPSALNQTLGILEQEAEQQRASLEAFERDLEEIQSDKQNLEAILQSLPSGC
ncbi:hypothetical protein Chor_002036 [Crotalus horridus]